MSSKPSHREFDNSFYCRATGLSAERGRVEQNDGNCPHCGEHIIKSRAERSREERLAPRRTRLENETWDDRPEDDLLEYAAKAEESLYQYCRMVIQMRGSKQEMVALEQANREGRLLEFAMGKDDG